MAITSFEHLEDSSNAEDSSPWVMPLAGGTIAVIVGVAMLRGGVHITPVNDGWFVIATNVDGFAFRDDASRILANWPTWLGLALTPDTTVGLQIVLGVFAIARGIAVAGIVRLLGGRAIAVLVAGVLAASYPSDTGLFWIGALGFHSAVVLLLVSVYLYLRYLRSGRSRDLIVGLVAQMISLWTHQVGVALFAVFALWFLGLMRKKVPRPGLPAAYGPLIVSFVNILVIGAQLIMRSGRTSAVVDVDPVTMIRNYGAAGGVILWHGWLSALSEISVPLLLLAVTAVVAGVKLSSGSGSVKELVQVGCITAILGFMPFAMTTVGLSTRRTLLLASIGAGIALAGVCSRLLRWQPILAMAVAAVAIAVGGMHLSNDRSAWVEASLTQQSLIGEIAEKIPVPSARTVIVVDFDSLTVRESVLGLANRDLALTYALQYVYDVPLLAISRMNPAQALEWHSDGVSVDVRGMDEEVVRGADEIYVVAVGVDRVEVRDRLSSADVEGELGVASQANPRGRVCFALDPDYRPSQCDRECHGGPEMGWRVSPSTAT